MNARARIALAFWGRFGPAMLIGLSVLSGPAAARAQSYTVEWFTIDGGGGSSSGGSFQVTGTAGQPDSGNASGGIYELSGGFWAGAAESASVIAPMLFVARSGASLIISWSPNTPGFMLEQSDRLSPASWLSMPDGNPATVPLGPGLKFYRLRKF